ncbi:Solute carrier family 40 member 1 [Hyphodiscus hymeniophilus]|uniref:Solute carrier family 40 member n=1 Tax=Hyphodiscus hymeniophilus TaxID=353542 RepID=A0A9P6VEP4_9HELO|nr:Solute carrier family 40 member 1 [Hyphodiscus hymeniophilus]
MESFHIRRRSSLALKDGEDFFIDAQQPDLEDMKDEKPLRENGARGSEVDEDNSDYLELLNDEEVCSVSSIMDLKVSQSRANGRKRWWKVYALHFLFMWNARTYEYASVVLLSLAFPQNLFAASLRGVTSTVLTMLCSSVVGSWIDRSSSRSRPLLISISSNNGAIVATYLCWLLWPMVVGPGKDDDPGSQPPFSSFAKGSMFVVILLMDVIYDLGATCNLLSIQKEWIPVLVGPAILDTSYGLTQINSVMSRIDLTCKLVAPSLLPVIIASFNSRAWWIILLIVVTILFWVMEVWICGVITEENEQLRLPKTRPDVVIGEDRETPAKYGEIKHCMITWSQKFYFVFYRYPRTQLTQYFLMPSRASMDDSTHQALRPPHLLLSIILFAFLSLTRVGHWMFYLMVQEIEQVEIPSSQRATFGGTEQSFHSFFELCHWGATMIWNQPEDFKMLSLGNLTILGLGAALFVWWQGKEVRSGGPARYEEISMDEMERDVVELDG